MRNFIGLVGLIDSGKGTVGDYLEKAYGFESHSFADSLKDAVSSIFGWPRHLLEGDTKESRSFREQVDEYWSNALDIPGLTPRMILQRMGTEVFRENFDPNIWIHSLERRITTTNLDKDVVITDVRFPNEIDMIKRLGGTIFHIARNEPPSWFLTAIHAPELMKTEHSDVHESEYAWISTVYGDPDTIFIPNDGTLQELKFFIDGHMRKVKR